MSWSDKDMFLLDNEKPPESGVEVPRTRKGRQKKQSSITKPKKVHSSNQIIKVTVPKSIFPEEEENGKVIKEEIRIHAFITEPAKIGAHWTWSMQINNGEGGVEWQGFRIYIEVPCYVECLRETQKEVIEKVKYEAEQQQREFVNKIIQRSFGDDKSKKDLGLM